MDNVDETKDVKLDTVESDTKSTNINQSKDTDMLIQPIKLVELQELVFPTTNQVNNIDQTNNQQIIVDKSVNVDKTIIDQLTQNISVNINFTEKLTQVKLLTKKSIIIDEKVNTVSLDEKSTPIVSKVTDSQISSPIVPTNVTNLTNPTNSTDSTIPAIITTTTFTPKQIPSILPTNVMSNSTSTQVSLASSTNIVHQHTFSQLNQSPQPIKLNNIEFNNYYLSFDCACATLGYILTKIVDVDVNNFFIGDNIINPKSIKLDVVKQGVINLVEGFLVKDVPVRNQIYNLRVFLDSLVKDIDINTIHVIIEDQPYINDNSNQIQSGLYMYFAYAKSVVSVQPTYKNTICFSKTLNIQNFYERYTKTYSANKEHAAQNLSFYYKINNIGLDLKKSLYNHLGDAFMQFIYIIKEKVVVVQKEATKKEVIRKVIETQSIKVDREQIIPKEILKNVDRQRETQQTQNLQQVTQIQQSQQESQIIPTKSTKYTKYHKSHKTTKSEPIILDFATSNINMDSVPKTETKKHVTFADKPNKVKIPNESKASTINALLAKSKSISIKSKIPTNLPIIKDKKDTDSDRVVESSNVSKINNNMVNLHNGNNSDSINTSTMNVPKKISKKKKGSRIDIKDLVLN